MVREAVFDMLASAGGLGQVRALDLFAGSGAMGIEALSRGVGHVTFVDADPRAAAAVRANLCVLGPLVSRGEVVCSDVMGWLARSQVAGFELALCDPPYAFERWGDLFALIERAVVAEALVVVESSRQVQTPASWVSVRSRAYGASVVSIVRSPQCQPQAASQKGSE